MKTSVFALFLAAIPSIAATVSLSLNAKFEANVRVVNAHMFSLSAALHDVRSVAKSKKHSRIVAKCDEAQAHLDSAKGSWTKISVTFSLAPWNAGLSAHGASVRTRLNSCNKVLQYIYAQPEVKATYYIEPLAYCKSAYQSCQSGCQQLWTWPSPQPKPSQAYHRDGYGHSSTPRTLKACPGTETSCPIQSGYLSSGTECIDTKTDVRSCGGCVSQGKGENCLEIRGADGVGCSNGKCVVLSTHKGYGLTSSGRPHKK